MSRGHSNLISISVVSVHPTWDPEIDVNDDTDLSGIMCSVYVMTFFYM
jgi:hypothetical protein